MDSYDDLRREYGSRSDSEKLAILRAELLRLLNSAQAQGTLIKLYVDERGSFHMPDSFATWVHGVVAGITDAETLLSALTDPIHRDVMREHQEQRQQELAAWLWQDAQAFFPELATYATLDSAVRATAHRLALPLWERTTEEPHTFWVTGGLVEYRTREQGPRARCSTQRAHHGRHYLGYGISLIERVDERNATWVEHEGLTQSLEEATTVLSHWLVDQWSMTQIGEIYAWMRASRVDRSGRGQ